MVPINTHVKFHIFAIQIQVFTIILCSTRGRHKIKKIFLTFNLVMKERTREIYAPTS